MGLVNFPTLLMFVCLRLLVIHKVYAAPVCKDLDSKCSHYDATYCNYHNIKQQCPLTCNQCVNISPSSTVILPTSSHQLAPTQSTVSVNTHGSDSNGEKNNHNTTVTAAGATTGISQTNVLVMIGICWSYLLSCY